MALPPVEIRYKKSALYLFLVFMVFVFLAASFMVCFSGVVPARLPIFFLNMLVMGVVVVLMYRWINNPLPVLVFLSDGLRLPRKGDRFIPWGSITEWKVVRQKNVYLIIRTSQGKVKIDISWLELSAKDIKSMMDRYIRQPGPVGSWC